MRFNTVLPAAIALALVLAVPAGALGALPLVPDLVSNDAGRGRDAPDTSGEAVPIAAGTYRGTLPYALGDREDWYLVVAPAATSLRFTFVAEAGGLWGGIHRGADGSLFGNAYSSGNTVVLEAPAGTYRLGLGDARGVGHAAYRFTVEIVQNDAGSGGDAPQAGLPIGPGTYSGAVLYAGGDREDWYTIHVPETTAVRVTFAAVEGGLWGGLHRGSDGALIENAWSSGGTVVLDAGAGPLRIGFGDHTARSGSASYTFTVEILQDDAGSGGDASQGGLALEPGTYTGAVVFAGRADNEDWYTIVVPEGRTLRVTFHATEGHLWGGIHSGVDGALIENDASWGQAVTLTAGDGPLRIGFGDHRATSGAASYAFTVEIV